MTSLGLIPIWFVITVFAIIFPELSNIVETTDETDLSGELACAGGSCEVTGL